MPSFADRLTAEIQRKNTPALVGLDPRWEWLPQPIRDRARKENPAGLWEERALGVRFFCERIVEIVAPLVPAVKPQAAFFEQLGPPGVAALRDVIRFARGLGLIVICDAKRGDIGSTAEAYANAFLAGEDPDAAPFAADALTVNPFLGEDTLMPLVGACEERGAGIYVLVRTSNPGSGSLQGIGDPTVSRTVATIVEHHAVRTVSHCGYGCVGAVVGATYPEELAALRTQMPHAPLLIPGYGSQGGSANDVAAAFGTDMMGALVNSSRAINYAWRTSNDDEDRWEEAVEAATRRMVADLACVV